MITEMKVNINGVFYVPEEKQKKKEPKKDVIPNMDNPKRIIPVEADTGWLAVVSYRGNVFTKLLLVYNKGIKGHETCYRLYGMKPYTLLYDPATGKAMDNSGRCILGVYERKDVKEGRANRKQAKMVRKINGRTNSRLCSDRPWWVRGNKHAVGYCAGQKEGK